MTTPSAASRYDHDAALASLKQPEDFIMVDLALVDALDGDHLAAILFARIAFRSRRRPWRATYDDLAAETRLNRMTMRRRLASLRDAGLITAEPVGGFDQAMVYDVPGRVRMGQAGPAPSVQDEPPEWIGENQPLDQREPMEGIGENHSSLLIEGKNKSENVAAAPSALEDALEDDDETPPADVPRSSRRRPAKPLPDDWKPTPAHVAYAGEHGIDLPSQAFRFRNHATANDRRQVSWDAAFSNWLATSLRREPLARHRDLKIPEGW